jgi:hypothetical protein
MNKLTLNLLNLTNHSLKYGYGTLRIFSIRKRIIGDVVYLLRTKIMFKISEVEYIKVDKIIRIYEEIINHFKLILLCYKTFLII